MRSYHKKDKRRGISQVYGFWEKSLLFILNLCYNEFCIEIFRKDTPCNKRSVHKVGYMNNSDILELRKRFKKTDSSITKITGCYVTGEEKRIKTYIDSYFADLEEEEQFKYIEIFKKGLSGVLGKNLFTLEFTKEEKESGSAQASLLALRNSELKNKELLDAFYQKVIENYSYVGNYLILIMHDVYDVMTKTSDKIALDESEEVYTYCLCCICPVNLSKPGLSYHSEENIIANRVRDWVVEMPDAAFLYPAFNDRSCDVNEVLYYVKNTDEMHSEFVEGILGCEEEIPSNVEKEMFSQFVEEVINEVPGYDTFEVVRAINNELTEMTDNRTVYDPVTLDKEGAKDLLLKSGVKEEHLPIVEQKFNKTVGEDGELHLDSICERKNFEVKSDNMQLKMKAEAADIVEIRVIDGRKCIVIPMNSDVEVNGIVKRIVKELEGEGENE